MRAWLSAAVAAMLLSGAAAAQTPAVSQAAAPAVPNAQAAEASPARTERVCKSEPIANSRLKSKKICMSRAEYERIRNAQKQMVRENLDRGAIQAKQGGG